jgi:hypothetical protein
MKTLMFLGLLGLAASATAASIVTGEATVQWKRGVQDKVLVGETMWSCQGTTCRGQLVENVPTLQRACRQLARQAGAVQTFRTPAQTLAEPELARCNR